MKKTATHSINEEVEIQKEGGRNEVQYKRIGKYHNKRYYINMLNITMECCYFYYKSKMCISLYISVFR